MCVVAAIHLPEAAAGQVAGRGATVPELRADLFAGTVSAAQFAAGVRLRGGTYAHGALVAGAGVAWKDGAQGTSARIEAQARFHLDPFREQRIAAYGSAGIAALYDPFARWQPRVTLALGVELPSRARGTWAIEAGVGGGFRLALILRRAVPGRR